MKNSIYLLLFSILILSSCTTKQKEEVSAKYVEEFHSFAQPNKAVIKHMDLDVIVDFDKQIIKGKVSYQIEHQEANEIILDSKFLNIEKVAIDGAPTTFHLGRMDQQLGQALHIKLKPKTKAITIYYETTNQTEALQWLSPQQTADKTHPFLLTQGQAILTRTWIPIQDSPQLRVTYNAKVQVPNALMAVMSAENPKERAIDGIYNFKMRQAISPYLIALAVGDIAYKSISPQTGVYAEKSMLEKVHYEFADMDKMLKAAENLYGTYAWDQFDVIVLPPSFPFGGMENPRLTFATPTVIAGDRSLTSLVAHELAHSWSGNLVTNATWDDFWLNEGFTVYFEMRIMEALYGKDRANMLALISQQDLAEEIEGFKEEPEKTHLKLNLKGHNPDDGMNSIAYDKGYLFLRTLEEKVGREKFDQFLKTYFEKHAFSTMYTEKFIAYLNKELLEKHQVTFNTEEWIYQAGIPSNKAIIESDKFQIVEQMLVDFMKTNTINESLTKAWTTQEWVHFVRNIPKEMTTKQIAILDKKFDLSHAKNSYIAMVWYDQCIRHNYHENGIDQQIETFLMTVGRRWYVSTIYTALKESEQQDKALEIYKKARPNYHMVTANSIDKLLGYKG